MTETQERYLIFAQDNYHDGSGDGANALMMQTSDYERDFLNYLVTTHPKVFSFKDNMPEGLRDPNWGRNYYVLEANPKKTFNWYQVYDLERREIIKSDQKHS